jgi:NADH-quinone oxidoreductase subunit F
MLAMFDELVAGRGSLATSRGSKSCRPACSSAAVRSSASRRPVLDPALLRDEYEAHIDRRACPAGICRDLTAYEIVEVKCDGCHACFKACPVDAITGVVKEKHVIHQDRCISCGACWDACPTQAIRFFPKAERTVA